MVFEELLSYGLSPSKVFPIKLAPFIEMVVGIMIRTMYGEKRPVNIKYKLDTLKEGLFFFC